MRTKEYLVAVRIRDGLLALTTMRFADEIRDTKEIDSGAREPAKGQLDQAVALIDALTTGWDPSRYEDRYRERLKAIVRKKEKGQTIKAPAQEKEPGATPDLMAALRKTLDEIGGRGRGGNGGSPEDLEQLSRDELYRRAQDADVPGRSSMSKEELVGALSRTR
jgi:DNA end-binding protein Ku